MTRKREINLCMLIKIESGASSNSYRNVSSKFMESGSEWRHSFVKWLRISISVKNMWIWDEMIVTDDVADLKDRWITHTHRKLLFSYELLCFCKKIKWKFNYIKKITKGNGNSHFFFTVTHQLGDINDL